MLLFIKIFLLIGVTSSEECVSYSCPGKVEICSLITDPGRVSVENPQYVVYMKKDSLDGVNPCDFSEGSMANSAYGTNLLETTPKSPQTPTTTSKTTTTTTKPTMNPTTKPTTNAPTTTKTTTTTSKLTTPTTQSLCGKPSKANLYNSTFPPLEQPYAITGTKYVKNNCIEDCAPDFYVNYLDMCLRSDLCSEVKDPAYPYKWRHDRNGWSQVPLNNPTCVTPVRSRRSLLTSHCDIINSHGNCFKVRLPATGGIGTNPIARWSGKTSESEPVICNLVEAVTISSTVGLVYQCCLTPPKTNDLDILVDFSGSECEALVDLDFRCYQSCEGIQCSVKRSIGADAVHDFTCAVLDMKSLYYMYLTSVAFLILFFVIAVIQYFLATGKGSATFTRTKQLARWILRIARCLLGIILTSAWLPLALFLAPIRLLFMWTIFDCRLSHRARRTSWRRYFLIMMILPGLVSPLVTVKSPKCTACEDCNPTAADSTTRMVRGTTIEDMTTKLRTLLTEDPLSTVKLEARTESGLVISPSTARILSPLIDQTTDLQLYDLGTDVPSSTNDVCMNLAETAAILNAAQTKPLESSARTVGGGTLGLMLALFLLSQMGFISFTTFLAMVLMYWTFGLTMVIIYSKLIPVFGMSSLVVYNTTSIYCANHVCNYNISLTIQGNQEDFANLDMDLVTQDGPSLNIRVRLDSPYHALTYRRTKLGCTDWSTQAFHRRCCFKEGVWGHTREDILSQIESVPKTGHYATYVTQQTYGQGCAANGCGLCGATTQSSGILFTCLKHEAEEYVLMEENYIAKGKVYIDAEKQNDIPSPCYHGKRAYYLTGTQSECEGEMVGTEYCCKDKDKSCVPLMKCAVCYTQNSKENPCEKALSINLEPNTACQYERGIWNCQEPVKVPSSAVILVGTIDHALMYKGYNGTIQTYQYTCPECTETNKRTASRHYINLNQDSGSKLSGVPHRQTVPDTFQTYKKERVITTGACNLFSFFAPGQTIKPLETRMDPACYTLTQVNNDEVRVASYSPVNFQIRQEVGTLVRAEPTIEHVSVDSMKAQVKGYAKTYHVPTWYVGPITVTIPVQHQFPMRAKLSTHVSTFICLSMVSCPMCRFQTRVYYDSTCNGLDFPIKIGGKIHHAPCGEKQQIQVSEYTQNAIVTIHDTEYKCDRQDLGLHSVENTKEVIVSVTGETPDGWGLTAIKEAWDSFIGGMASWWVYLVVIVVSIFLIILLILLIKCLMKRNRPSNSVDWRASWKPLRALA